MKKIILLIIAVFFLTGCDAEYTLEISNEVKENTKIYTLKTDESKYGDSFLKDFLNFLLLFFLSSKYMTDLFLKV